MASLTPKPDNEIERLKALQSYQILDTLPEEQLDRLTKLASLICETPITLISMIDENRQWFKSNIGLEGVTETPRDISFCQHAIMNDELFEVEDATKDDRFKDNVLVTGNPDIRFYAGQPIIDTNGYALGTLCLIDRKAHKLNDNQKKLMAVLAKEIAFIFEAQQKNKEREKFEAIFNMSPDLFCIAGMDGFFKKINPAFVDVLGYEQSELLEKPFFEYIHPDDIASTIKEMEKLSTGLNTVRFQNRYKTKNGHYVLLKWSATPNTAAGEIYAIGRDITIEKIKEDELFKSNQFQNAILNGTDYAIITTSDPDGIITSFNKGAEKMLGYSAEEVIGIKSPSIFHINEEVEAKAIALSTELNMKINPGIDVFHIKSRLGSSSDINEWTYIRKDGSLLTIELSISTLKDNNNNIISYLGIAKDITQEKINEEKLVKSIQFQNAILNGTDYAIISTDEDGLITQFNSGAENMLGFSKEEIVNKTSPAIFHDIKEVVERAKVLSKELSKNIEPGFEVFVAKSKSGVPDVNDWTYIKKDGIRIKVQLSVTALFDSDKNITGYLGIARDITEFLESQNKLKLSEEKHRVFFENAQGLMCTHDETGKFLSMNKAGAALIGYTPEELLQKTLYDVTPLKLKKGIDNYLEKIYNKGAAEGLMSVLHKNGDAKVWYYKNILVDYSTDKRIAIGNAIDITERVEMEDELKKAKLQAEKSVLAKDQFLANMSHEIRTPMNAILGFADVLKTTNLSKDQTEYLSAISNSGENLMVIINDILDFSKIDSGKLTLEHQPINIIKITNNIKKLLIHKANERNLAFNFYIENDLPEWVMGDSVRLNQILVNLLGNAIKFTEKGKVELYCNILNKSGNKCIVQFIVKDTGIGIPKDKHDLVFERFKQADDNTTRKFGGTGLGLSITKKLLELFNGKIEVKSEEGVGSEFIVSIPFEITDEKDKLELEEIERNSESKNYKVLLTEDNDLNQKLAKHILEKNNMVVEIASNGQIAVDMLKNNKYDIILMDLQMPVMDGYVATAFIRNVLNITTPMIAMTAHSLVGEKEKCIQCGMNEYISKPYKAKELIDKIKLLCAGEEVVLSEVSIPKTPTVKADYDLSDINELSGGDAEFTKEMIKIFLTAIPEDLNNLNTAVKNANIAEAKKVAHKIKASYALFMIQPLVELCDKIENGHDMKMIEKYSQIVTNSTDTILQSLAKEL